MLREYLYIDQLEINSLLAQYNKGLKTQETKSKSSNRSKSKDHKTNVQSETGGNLKISLIAKISERLALSTSKITKTSEGSNSNNSQSFIPGDYSVKMLESYMQNVLVEAPSNAKSGDFVKLNDDLKLINFNMIKSMTSPTYATNALSIGISELPKEFVNGKNMLQQIKQLQNLDKENGGMHQEEINNLYKNFSINLSNNIKVWDTSVKRLIHDSKKLFSATNELASFASSIFYNTILIYANNYIVYAELDHFRMNEAQLQMLQGTQRRINILGIVENISKNTNTFKEKNIPPIECKQSIMIRIENE